MLEGRPEIATLMLGKNLQMTTSAIGRGSSRRDLLKIAICVVGGTAALAQLEACSSLGDSTTLARRKPSVLSDGQRTCLIMLSDVMLPATDTPGAVEAGVPGFIDLMLSDWASAASRERVLAAIDAIETRSRAERGAVLTGLSEEARLDLVRRHDSESIAAGNPGYRQLKQLVLLGYYQSEIGATRELRYAQVPGRWRGNVPLTEIGRAWAT